jgi:hypothetical protein
MLPSMLPQAKILQMLSLASIARLPGSGPSGRHFSVGNSHFLASFFGIYGHPMNSIKTAVQLSLQTRSSLKNAPLSFIGHVART